MSSFYGSFNTGTGAATTTVAVTGVGFLPKALIFWWSGRTESTDAIGRASQKRGFAVAVSATDRRSICDHSVDASASSDTATAHSDAACILSVSAANAIDGALDLQSMDADGFTLIVDDAMPVDLRVHFLALSDPTDVASIQFQIPASPGDQDITSLSFPPDFLLFFSNGETAAPPDGSGNARFMVGAATGASNQGVLLTYASNGEATMDTRAYCTAGECIAINNAAVPPVIVERADFVSFLSNGFRLNWAEINATRYIHCLALKGGNYHVGNLLTQTDTVTDITESGFGFPPDAAMFFSHGQAESTSDTLQDNDRISIGAFSGLTTRGAQGTLDEDAALTSEVTTAIEFDAVYVNISSASAVQGLMDVKSKDGDGFTMIMDDADPAQAFVWYAAFGPARFMTTNRGYW